MARKPGSDRQRDNSKTSASPVCYAEDFAHYNGLTSSGLKSVNVHGLHLKRVDEPPATGDGVRILVDGIWPAGVSRHAAQLDLWLKALAPSRELRQWFNQEPAKWMEFRTRYVQQLDTDPVAKEAVQIIRERLLQQDVTLLFAARNTRHNSAVALREYLEGRS